MGYLIITARNFRGGGGGGGGALDRTLILYDVQIHVYVL